MATDCFTRWRERRADAESLNGMASAIVSTAQGLKRNYGNHGDYHARMMLHLRLLGLFLFWKTADIEGAQCINTISVKDANHSSQQLQGGILLQQNSLMFSFFPHCHVPAIKAELALALALCRWRFAVWTEGPGAYGQVRTLTVLNTPSRYVYCATCSLQKKVTSMKLSPVHAEKTQNPKMLEPAIV